MSDELQTERIFLIGPRGSGKTTAARLVAAALGWKWADADAELEQRAGCTIRDIFAREGERGFRQREADVLGSLCRQRNLVVATGGGVVLRQDNRENLKAGRVVWLTADAAILWQRINADSSTAQRRPALTAAVGLGEVELVLQTREPLYRVCADIAVDTTDLTPEQTAQMILSSLTPPR